MIKPKPEVNCVSTAESIMTKFKSGSSPELTGSPEAVKSERIHERNTAM